MRLRKAKNAARKKGKDAAMSERRLQVAKFPKKLKPWERATSTAILPSSSSEEESETREPGVNCHRS